MKKTLAVVIAVLVVLSGAYYFLGLQAGSILEAQMARFQEQSGLGVVLKEKRGGVLSSEYLYVLSWTAPSDEPGAQGAMRTWSMELRQTLRHGPLPLGAGSLAPALAICEVGLVFTDDSPKDLRELMTEAPELAQSSLRSVIGFSGASRTTVAIAPLKKQTKDKSGAPVEVEWGGFEAEIDAAPEFAAYVMKGRAPLLRVFSPAVGVEMTDLSTTADMRLEGGNIYLGKSDFTIASLSVDDRQNPGKSFAGKDFTVTADAAREGETLRFAFAASAEATRTKSGEKTGFQAAGSVKNLDFAACDALVAEIQRINARPGPAEAKNEALLASFQAKAPALFSRGPRLDVEKLDVVTPTGGLKAKAFADYKPDGVAPPKNGPEFLSRLSAQVQAAVDEVSLLRFVDDMVGDPRKPEAQMMRFQIELVLRDLIEKGYLTREAQGYAAKAVWNGKSLTVNGKPLFGMP